MSRAEPGRAPAGPLTLPSAGPTSGAMSESLEVNENSDVYYTGTYWNDFELVRNRINTADLGRPHAEVARALRPRDGQDLRAGAHPQLRERVGGTRAWSSTGSSPRVSGSTTPRPCSTRRPPRHAGRDAADVPPGEHQHGGVPGRGVRPRGEPRRGPPHRGHRPGLPGGLPDPPRRRLVRVLRLRGAAPQPVPARRLGGGVAAEPRAPGALRQDLEYPPMPGHAGGRPHGGRALRADRRDLPPLLLGGSVHRARRCHRLSAADPQRADVRRRRRCRADPLDRPDHGSRRRFPRAATPSPPSSPTSPANRRSRSCSRPTRCASGRRPRTGANGVRRRAVASTTSVAPLSTALGCDSTSSVR